MKPVEFRRQIFRDVSHWDHGLSFRLERLEHGGIALFSRPQFTDFVVQSDEALSVANFAIDRCGRLLWIHRKNCHLYRFDPVSTLVESMIPLAECGANEEHLFGRVLDVTRRLWLLDRQDSRLFALRTDTFQIIAEISVSEPIDIAWANDHLFVLDRNGIAAYDVHGNRLSSPRSEHLSRPIAMGADPKGEWVYIIDEDASGFRRFTPDGSFHDEIGKFSDVAANFKPRLLVVHPGGNLFVCDGSKVIHEFSPDGGCIGNTGDMNPLTSILGLSFSSKGDLYASAPEGIAHFSFTGGLAGNRGVFYSNTLDSGGDGIDCWQRLDLDADLNDGGAVDVWYATSDDAALAAVVDNTISKDTAVAERVDTLEQLLEWNGPEQLKTFLPIEAAVDAAARSTFRERSSHSVLFRSDTKRYLWLKLELSGLAPKATAAVREMRVYYPRLSYLRYLPAVYQEDPASAEFLERFLSIFETVLSGIERTSERIPEVFDPKRTPKEFLDWLAQWLDLGIEEDWSEAVKRKLIANASRLYQKKGTPAGLAELIEIVTGRRPTILEAFESQRPFVLSDSTRLGFESRIFRRPMKDLQVDQRTLLGCGSVLGTSRISNTTQAPLNPFSAAAHRFTLLLDLTSLEFRNYEHSLHRIIQDYSPAHTEYEVRLVSGSTLGSYNLLDINSRVEDPQALHLGRSALGHSILKGFRYGPELGIDATLGGLNCGSKSVADSFYGER
jgi:phage tail-like protein